MKKSAPPPPAALTLPGTAIPLLAGLEALLVPIQDVSPDPANPRRLLDLEPLKGSLRRFGVRKPIVVNRRDRIIEAGHQTREACLALGATHIPVVWADDDRLNATAYNIADNRTAEVVAEWDDSALARLLKDLDAEGAAGELGFSRAQLDGLISSFADHEVFDEAPLGKTAFDDATEEDLGISGRVIIVFDNNEQKAALGKALGFTIERVLYRYDEIFPTADNSK
jgi:hypothetical protein